jgi:hypothetical protein
MRMLCPMVLAVRVTVDDVSELERMHSERRLLRQSYGCTNTRLVRDPLQPNRVLVLMEFPSTIDAKSYLSATSLSLGSERDMIEDPVVEYLEDVSLDEAVAAAS